MRQWVLPFVFFGAIVALLYLPNPQAFIIRVIECAGFVIIVARGLLGHYRDFLDEIPKRKRRRRR